ncbi:MAG: hypothetical protein R6U04_01635 [Bacteroidales bacterium]
MCILSNYLKRKNTSHQDLDSKPSGDLRYIVVIPCYNEPDIKKTLQSLIQADSPKYSTEVLIVINTPENAPEKIINQNKITYNQLLEWSTNNFTKKITFIPLYISELSAKDAGAGLARKIGMDTAIQRFYEAKKDDGYLISMDADTLCEKNYFTTIDQAIQKYKNLNAGIIYFEHPLKGRSLPEENYEAAAHYELFLRYYKQGLAYSGFLYPFHTIGSAFCVRAQAYAKQGGMNKRKAGEDFYFLNKIFQLGNIREINNTCVYPSPRPSERVLFGTGQEVKKLSQTKPITYKVYDPKYFKILKDYFEETLREFYKCPVENFETLLSNQPGELKTFLSSINFQKEWKRLHDNCSNEESFRKQFFHWFNGLKIIQFMHYTHPDAENKMDIIKASSVLLNQIGRYSNTDNVFELLKIYRKLEREKETNIP